MTIVDEKTTVLNEANSTELLFKRKILDLLKDNQGEDNFNKKIMSEVDKILLASVMRYTRNNQVKAARILGLSRGTLRNKLQEHDMLNKKSDQTNI